MRERRIRSRGLYPFLAGIFLFLLSVILFFSRMSSADNSSKKLPYKFFPNDFGPPSVDVSHYPPEIKGDYHLFLRKCSVCHTVARPLNAQFLQLSADHVARFKSDHPDFKSVSTDIVMPGPKAWALIVNRMMAKPGASISPQDGKKIVEFLVYDSKVRKTGKNFPAWETHREELLAHFRKLYPEMYKFLREIGEL